MMSVIPPVGVQFPWRFVLFPKAATGDSFGGLLKEIAGGDIYLTDSGRSALYLILKAAALNKPGRDEVIVPDYTCWSVPSAVVRVGLRVRPVEIELDSLGLSLESLKAAINKDTLAVIATHLFGIPNQIGEIEKVCRERGVVLIDDAAQGLGGSMNGRPLGSFGDVGLFSFGRGKNITTESGGAAAVRNEALSERMKAVYETDFDDADLSDSMGDIKLAAYKILFPRYLYWLPQRLPFLKLGLTEYNPDFSLEKMPPRNSARGAMMMARLDGITKSRKEAAARYQEPMTKIDLVGLPVPPSGSNPAWLRFPVYIENGDIRRYLLEKGQKWGISGMYPGTVTSIEALRPHLVSDFDLFPNAKKVAETLITLPTHFGVTDTDIQNIADFVEKSRNNR